VRKNKTKEKIHSGGVALGCFANMPSPEMVELCGLVGFDFVIVDAEHGTISYDAARHMIRAAETVDVTPIVRTPQNVAQVTLRYLDAGAQGIQFPQVFTKQDAELAVSSVKYFPLGRRGLAAARAANYGVTIPVSAYVKQANAETMIVFHIETVQTVENLPQILEVPEIDVFFVGPSDLSQSLGLPGQTTHPDVQALLARAVKEIRAAGRIAGTIVRSRADVERFTDMGVQYMANGATNIFIAGAQQMLSS
jgi:4-hydroxy-2-oxoheptanedioate aldolase